MEKIQINTEDLPSYTTPPEITENEVLDSSLEEVGNNLK